MRRMQDVVLLVSLVAFCLIGLGAAAGLVVVGPRHPWVYPGTTTTTTLPPKVVSGSGTAWMVSINDTYTDTGTTTNSEHVWSALIEGHMGGPYYFYLYKYAATPIPSWRVGLVLGGDGFDKIGAETNGSYTALGTGYSGSVTVGDP